MCKLGTMLDHIKLCILPLIWLTYIGHDVCSAQSLCEGGEATLNTEYRVMAETGNYTGFVWVRPSDDINVVICNPNCSNAEAGYSATKNDTHSTLTIDSVTFRDAGIWTIQDANDETAAASNVCNLTLSGTFSSMTTAKPVDTGPDSTLPLPLYLIIIIAVGAALLIAVIIIIICIVRWRRKCEKYGVHDAEKSYKAPKEEASPVQNLCESHPANGEPIETIDTTLATKPKDEEDIPREMALSNGMLSQAPDLDKAEGMDETSLVASKEADVEENDNTDGPVCDAREDPGDGESDREKDVATTEADTVAEPEETGPDHTGLFEDGESGTPMDLPDNGATEIGSIFEGLGEPSEDMPQEQGVSDGSGFPPTAEDSNEGKSDNPRDEGRDEDGNGASDNSPLDESVLQELSALGDNDSYDVAGATEDGDLAVYVPERAGEPE
ncbi:uncharacterized protein [Haliotis asinina]|uniref:uncharacterized protein n=1 Tax=Haliotis asinina TaxID=109174 RepID=UPI00353258BB